MCQALYIDIVSYPHSKLTGEVFHYPQLGEIGTLRLGIGHKREVTGEARIEPKCAHLL